LRLGHVFIAAHGLAAAIRPAFGFSGASSPRHGSHELFNRWADWDHDVFNPAPRRRSQLGTRRMTMALLASWR